MKKFFKGLFKSSKDYTKSFLNRVVDGFLGLIKIIAILVGVIILILMFQCGILLLK